MRSRLSCLAWVVFLLGGCSPDVATGPGDQPAGGDETGNPGIEGKILLGRYRFEGDPSAGTWNVIPDPIDPTKESVEGVGQVAQGLGNGDEPTQVLQSQFGLANCRNALCGCTPLDVPVWYGGTCVPGQQIGYGRVRLTNNTSNLYFINPTLVFTNLQPSSLKFFAVYPDPPPPPTDTCTTYAATRTVAPYLGSYYLRYGDVAPGGCDKGYVDDLWITAVTDVSQVSLPHSFSIYVYVDALSPINVMNGTFENGLTNWTGTGVTGATTMHCSHQSDFSCGVGDAGVLPPSGTGQMARLINTDGGSSYTGALTSAAFMFQSAQPKLQFQYKMGSREGNGCTSMNNDEFYVEVRKNSGTWTVVPMSNPPDVDSSGKVGTGRFGYDNYDCASFHAIDLPAVYENTWTPGTSGNPQLWGTAALDISQAPISAVQGDSIEVRFTVAGGPPYPQIAASVFLLDNVTMIP